MSKIYRVKCDKCKKILEDNEVYFCVDGEVRTGWSTSSVEGVVIAKGDYCKNCITNLINNK